MIQNLDHLVEKYNYLQTKLSDHSVIKNQTEYKKVIKESRDLEEVVECYLRYKNCFRSLEECEEILKTESDTELKELAKSEKDELLKKKMC